jgi:hypothetical protein
MASIHKEIGIDASPAVVWDAMRDLGALHTRLVKGFVVDCKLEGETRLVRFANGLQASERIIDVCDKQRRVVWSAAGDRLKHHNASAQVLDGGEGRSRVVWVADLLPHEMAPAIAGMIEHGLQAMRRTLEASAETTAGSDWRGG